MPRSLKTGRVLAAAAALLLLAACGSTPTGAENLPSYPTGQSGQALLPDWEHIPQNEVLPEENEEPAENDGQSGEKQPEKTDAKAESKADDKSGWNFAAPHCRWRWSAAPDKSRNSRCWPPGWRPPPRCPGHCGGSGCRWTADTAP